MSVASVASSSASELQNGGVVQSSSQQGELNMNDFFTLMAAQLQYQDPMNPTDDNEYMGEMAQFGALEQLTNISGMLNYSIASGIVGKQVKYSHNDEQTGATQTGSGVVSAVDVSGTTPLIEVGSQWIGLSDVQQILSDGTAATAST